jgi:hypothetical protein
MSIRIAFENCADGWVYWQPESPNLEDIRKRAAELPLEPVGIGITWEEYDRSFSQAPESETMRLLRRIAQPRDYEIVTRHLRQQGFLS